MSNDIITNEKRYSLNYDMGDGAYVNVEPLIGSGGLKELYTVRSTMVQGTLLAALAHREGECTYVEKLYCEQDGLIKEFIKYLLEYNVYRVEEVAIKRDLLDDASKGFYEFYKSWYEGDEDYLFLDVYRCYDVPC